MEATLHPRAGPGAAAGVAAGWAAGAVVLQWVCKLTDSDPLCDTLYVHWLAPENCRNGRKRQLNRAPQLAPQKVDGRLCCRRFMAIFWCFKHVA